MATFRMIEKALAPEPEETPNEFLVYVQQAASDPEMVGEVVPDAGQTTRAIKRRLTNAGKKAHLSVRSWADGNIVYFAAAPQSNGIAA